LQPFKRLQIKEERPIKLNLKIPPLALTAVFISFMFATGLAPPQVTLNIPSNILASVLLAMLVISNSLLGEWYRSVMQKQRLTQQKQIKHL